MNSFRGKQDYFIKNVDVALILLEALKNNHTHYDNSINKEKVKRVRLIINDLLKNIEIN